MVARRLWIWVLLVALLVPEGFLLSFFEQGSVGYSAVALTITLTLVSVVLLPLIAIGWVLTPTSAERVDYRVQESVLKAEQAELRRVKQGPSMAPVESVSAPLASGRLEEVEAELAQIAPSARLDEERRAADLASSGMFVLGLVVVLVVLVVSILTGTGGDDISTPAALARAAIVGAAFYLAGQLFRRSTMLNVRAQEFRRGAVALDVLEELAGNLSDESARDHLRLVVYEHHLTGATSEQAIARPAGEDRALGLIESWANARAGASR